MKQYEVFNSATGRKHIVNENALQNLRKVNFTDWSVVRIIGENEEEKRNNIIAERQCEDVILPERKSDNIGCNCNRSTDIELGSGDCCGEGNCEAETTADTSDTIERIADENIKRKSIKKRGKK